MDECMNHYTVEYRHIGWGHREEFIGQTPCSKFEKYESWIEPCSVILE
jgi:hypothetical protein